MRARRLGIGSDQLGGRLACGAHEVPVALDVGKAQQRQAALALAEILAGAAQQQVAARDLEAVRALVNHLQAFAGAGGQRAAEEQDARAVARAAADAAAQLRSEERRVGKGWRDRSAEMGERRSEKNTEPNSAKDDV